MKTIISILIALALAFSPMVYGQSLITFDDIVGGSPLGARPIQEGYQGLAWNNFGVLNATSFPSSSGYANGLVSSPNVAYNLSGNPASFSSVTPFIIVSGDFTAAWANGLSLEITGLNGTATAFDQTYTLSMSGPTIIDFPDASVTQVDFSASGGVDVAYPGAGPVFALDNLTLKPTPEPTTWALMTSGAGLLGVLRGRCKR